jgi:hypothetical protein
MDSVQAISGLPRAGVPRLPCRVRQTPHALTLTRICPSPELGVGALLHLERRARSRQHHCMHLFFQPVWRAEYRIPPGAGSLDLSQMHNG